MNEPLLNYTSCSVVIKGGTIIICPLSIMEQWSDEIQNNTSINVKKHHGYKREMSAIELAKEDIVITTYNIVRLDHKNHKNTVSIQCRYTICTTAHKHRRCNECFHISTNLLKYISYPLCTLLLIG